MQYRGELEAGVTYVEDMVTPSDGFWRGAPLFASPDKVIKWQERFVQMAVRLKSDIGSSQTLVGNITGWEVGYEDSTIGPMVDAATPGMLFGGGVRIFVGNIDNRQAYIQEGQEGAISFRKRIPVWLEFVVVPEAAAGAESFAVGWTDDSGEDFIEDTGIPDSNHTGALFVFRETDTTAIQFHTSKTTTQTTTEAGSGVIAADTEVRLGMHWDGAGTVTPWVNGVPGTVHTLTAEHGPGRILMCAKTHAAAYHGLNVKRFHMLIDRRNDATLV